MIPKLLYQTLFAVLLIINLRSEAQTTTHQSKNPVNSMSAEVSGDQSMSMNVSGENKATLGLLKFTKTDISAFSLAGSLTNSNKTSYAVVFSISPSLKTGIEQVGDLGTFSMITSKETRNFSTDLYRLYFETDHENKNSKVYLTFTLIQDAGEYLKVSGNYHFNAAYDPNPDSQKAMSANNQLPLFNGAERGSKKVKVNGSFTAYLPKIMQN
ncbi:hypothetical protein H7F33_08775 [Pedobacter sp. PAMC26386]|nr:hypothetical protein H7F33_08775 [Pedobacter sp. PAMC26386]